MRLRHSTMKNHRRVRYFSLPQQKSIRCAVASTPGQIRTAINHSASRRPVSHVKTGVC